MEIEAFLFFNENFSLGDAITCCNIRRQNQIREEFFQIKCICFKLYRYIYIIIQKIYLKFMIQKEEEPNTNVEINCLR